MSALLVATLLCAAPTPSGTPRPPKIVLIDLAAGPGIDPKALPTLNDFLAGALRDQKLDVVTSADVGALLGLERQRQLMGCSESACLAEIGGALGADDIVHGSVARLEDGSAVSLTLVDAHGRVLNQVRDLPPASMSAQLKSIEALVPKLVAPLKRTAPSLAPVETPPAAGGLQASASSGRAIPWKKVALGAGVAGIAVGTVFLVLAEGQVGKAKDATNQADYDDAHKKAHGDAQIATWTAGVGLVVAAAAAVLVATDTDGEPAAGAPEAK